MKNIKYIISFIILSVLTSLSYATQNQLPVCISKHYGGTTIASDQISLIAPDIAEDGSVVSIGIDKIKPLPKDTFIQEVSFYNEFRDEPLATFFLSKQMRGENLKTRIRLRESSNLYAVAKLDNGQLMGGKSFIKVTIGGCGGGGSGTSFSKTKKVCAE